MKNSIYLLLLFLYFDTLSAQNLIIPDINFKNKLLQANFNNNIAKDQFDNPIRIDVNNDAEIQASELNIVRRLNVSNSNIFDLSGIENFHNIKNINCNFNQISALNISMLNNVVWLECKNNNLNSINITGLVALRYFNCSNNNLNSINISALAGLEYFDCSYNQLNNINFVGNTNLNKLLCSNNLLSNLDLLNQVNLYWVYCSNNLLTDMNLTGSYNIDKLYCQNNNLTNLNLSSNTNLFEINCSNNSINYLNVSGLTNLTILDCSFNQITSNSLLFSQNNALVNLYLQNNLLSNLIITPNDINLPNLARINCDNNQLLILNLSSTILIELSLVGNLNLSTLVINLPALGGTLDVSNKQLINLEINNGYSLQKIICKNNILANVTALNMHRLIEFDCSNNHLSNLTLSGLYYEPGNSGSGLTKLNCNNNLLTSLNLLGNINFYGVELNCNQNLFTFLDFSSKRIKTLDFGNNPNITSVNLKNNFPEQTVLFSNTPNMQNFCQDQNQVGEIQIAVNSYGYTNCTVSSNCVLDNKTFIIDADLNIYPNPAKDILNIEINKNTKTFEIKILNILGQEVINMYNQGPVSAIDVSQLPIGTYLIKINNQLANMKFIKF